MMSIMKYVPFLAKRIYFAIAVPIYKRKHPEFGKGLSADKLEETAKELTEKNRTADRDVMHCDEELRKGLTIQKITLQNTEGYLVSKEGNRKGKIIYYIHGGGFTSGSTKERFRFISYAVRHFGYNMFSIDYRLAPEFKCMDVVSDCVDGYRYLLESYEGKDICLMGESAGGALVLSLTHRLKDLGVELPKAISCHSPLSQFEFYPYSYYTAAAKTDFMIGFGTIENIYPLYKGDLDYTSPYMSPLYGDLSGFPDIYLDVSKHESMRDDARMLYAKLMMNHNQVEYHEFSCFGHAQLVCPNLRHVRNEEYPLVMQFLKKELG